MSLILSGVKRSPGIRWRKLKGFISAPPGITGDGN